MTRLIRIVAVLTLGLSLAACERREGPVERTAEGAGREVDRGAERARESAEKAGDRAEDAAKDARDSAEDATK